MPGDAIEAVERVFRFAKGFLPDGATGCNEGARSGRGLLGCKEVVEEALERGLLPKIFFGSELASSLVVELLFADFEVTGSFITG